MIKIFLKICFFAVFFINQSFAQQEISSAWGQTLGWAPQIASSINPIHQIAKFISGDNKSNSLLINPRISEHDYQFRVSDIRALNKADVVFYINNNLENHFVKALASLEKQPKVVQLSKSKNIKLLTFQPRFNEEIADYHIWLSPENAVGIATEIADNLSALYPRSASTYKKNLKQFIIDVKNMDEENKIKLLKVRAKSFIIDHNSTAYFENYYNLPAAGVMRYHHNQDLTHEDIAKINNLIKTNQVVCVLGSPQELSSLAVQIASNNKVKFALINVIGNKINYRQNGYTKIMSNLVDDLVRCAKTK